MRRSPSTALALVPTPVQAAAALYRDIHVVEARHAKPADAIAAGLEEFGRRLDALGMTYDEFVWSLTKGKKSV